MLAVVPVRDGALPAGADETVAECGGRVIVVGSGTLAAAQQLSGIDVRAAEVGAFAPGAWADALAPLVVNARVIVLPASPDGRDLAPRLAHRLARPLLAGAIVVREDGAAVARYGGLVIEDYGLGHPFVATLQPGVRGLDAATTTPAITVIDVPIGASHDATVLEVLPPDAATIDLAEAPRIVAGGAGLTEQARFVQLQRVATALGASMGATRVITDRGWVGHERQIGTTGVTVAPRLYVAFGISGAVQHTSGLGAPDHIVSVNVDPYCPMMQLADLAIVSDANAVLDHLEERLAAVALGAAS